MANQPSYQSGRVEAKLMHYFREKTNEVWYHLHDKQMVINQASLSKLSKMLFVIEKIIGKPVDEHIKTFTGNEEYTPSEPAEEMALLAEAMKSDTTEKLFEENEVTLTMKSKDEETYSTKDFIWDYSCSSHQGKGTRGN